MSKQRNITELVGRVVEMNNDKKRYLVMPLELRGKEIDAIIGTLEGRLSSEDLVYKNTVVIMPLEGLPEERIKLGNNIVEGKDFVVRNIRPEDTERVRLLNESMSEVLDNIKKLYRNLTELRELRKKQSELESKISKLEAINSEPLSRWDRPAKKAYLLELCRDEIEILNARKRLEDKDRPFYRTSLTGGSNASNIDVLELLKVTDKPIYYREGLAMRGAKANPISSEKAINRWTGEEKVSGWLDMSEDSDKIVIAEYSSNDMY